MTALLKRLPRRQRVRVAATALLLALAWPSIANPAPTFLEIVLDQATILKIPAGVATIVIGNPLIADVSMQGGGMMVVTGKGFGMTNIVALDRGGNVLMDRMVQVVGPRDNVVVVYRGLTRESYSCAPMCERRITLGDSTEYFESTIAQTGTRNARAQGGQQTSPAAR
jgi:Flp pilus assembly secretin CpaC